jgi:hypothetical protein
MVITLTIPTRTNLIPNRVLDSGLFLTTTACTSIDIAFIAKISPN